jgi:hypothetical protein
MKKLEDSNFYKNNSSRILPQTQINISKETATLDSRMEERNEFYYSAEQESFSSAREVYIENENNRITFD